MARYPSRRDSNRTLADMIRILAAAAKRDGTSEAEFLGMFNAKYKDRARQIYQEVMGK